MFPPLLLSHWKLLFHRVLITQVNFSVFYRLDCFNSAYLLLSSSQRLSVTHLDACGAVQVLAGSFPYLRRLINPVSDTQRCPEIKQQKINKINERTILDT